MRSEGVINDEERRKQLAALSFSEKIQYSKNFATAARWSPRPDWGRRKSNRL